MACNNTQVLLFYVPIYIKTLVIHGKIIRKFHVKRSHLPSREKQEELEGSWAQKIGAAALALAPTNSDVGIEAARESHAYKMKAYWRLNLTNAIDKNRTL